MLTDTKAVLFKNINYNYYYIIEDKDNEHNGFQKISQKGKKP